MIETQLNESAFDFVRPEDKRFIAAFTHELETRGYTYGGEIGSGFCWGKYMLIFRKAGVKSKNVFARIYIRENDIVLRLFFNNVTRHADYIRTAPSFIQEAFTGKHGTCKHCKGDDCRFRKDYEIDGVKYEKCNGTTFEFYAPDGERLPAYIALFEEFYPTKESQKRSARVIRA